MKYRKIREIREAKGISQEELAKQSNVSRTTISALESGRDIETYVGTIKSIADALKVPVSSLLA